MYFKIFYINFGYYSTRCFPSFKEALAYARSGCFQSRIDTNDGHTIASWCPMNGTRWIDKEVF